MQYRETLVKPQFGISEFKKKKKLNAERLPLGSVWLKT